MADELPDVTSPTYHMVFEGSPGTGKTTVARIVAKLFYNIGVLQTDKVKEVSRADLVGAYVGQTEEHTQKAVRDSLGGVLFIDEAYQLTSAGATNDFGKQAVETLITALENNRNKFVAIFAGYTDEMAAFLSSNPGLRSRIPHNIKFEDYTPTEIAEIVYRNLSRNWQVNKAILIKLVSEKYSTLDKKDRANGRWARNMSERIIAKQKLWLSQNLNAPDVTNISDDIILEAVNSD